MEIAKMVECPICGCETGHLNNHVRMSNDDGHGRSQEYPEGWNPATETLQEANDDRGDQEANDDRDGRGELVDVDDEPEAVAIEIEDRPSDMRSYECVECEASIDYLASECPNEHEQQWYA